MKETLKKDWKGLYQRFDAWWKFDNTDRPLMWIEANRPEVSILPEEKYPQMDADKYEDNKINPYRSNVRARNHAARTEFLAEAFPTAELDFGPGVMGAFLGARPHFTPHTVWYEPLCGEPGELRSLPLRLDSEYYLKAKEYFGILARLSNGEYIVPIPDLIDSMDTISALLGTQKTLFALVDEPETLIAASDLLDDHYFEYYERMRDIVLNDDGMMSVQAYTILGSRVAKLQCDMSAMISPKMFDTFIAPSLAKYCARLDHAMYHIDGEGEMCHVDTMLNIKGLDAFQWIPQGAWIGTSFTDPRFYPMFDKIHGAGKGLYLLIQEGGPDDWADETQKMLDRYGPRGMYFLYPRFPDVKTAERFLLRFSK